MTYPVREPDRVIKALLRASKAYPDQRVMQVIANALGSDAFYIEDDEAALALHEYANAVWDREVNQ